MASCCPQQHTMDLLGKRHALTIIWLLQQESPRRFNEIKKSLDVNPVTLSARLEDLAQEGIIQREQFPEVPPRVEYRLTSKGEALLPVIRQLCDWAMDWQDQTPLAQTA